MKYETISKPVIECDCLRGDDFRVHTWYLCGNPVPETTTGQSLCYQFH